MFFGLVHVDDCARVHVGALNTAKIHGNQILMCAWNTVGKSAEKFWQDALEKVENVFPRDIENKVFELGREPFRMLMQVDSTKTEELFEFKFKNFSEQVLGVSEWYSGLVKKVLQQTHRPK